MYPASILSYYVVTLPISLQQYANLLLICRLVHCVDIVIHKRS